MAQAPQGDPTIRIGLQQEIQDVQTVKTLREAQSILRTIKRDMSDVVRQIKEAQKTGNIDANMRGQFAYGQLLQMESRAKLFTAANQDRLEFGDAASRAIDINRLNFNQQGYQAINGVTPARYRNAGKPGEFGGVTPNYKDKQNGMLGGLARNWAKRAMGFDVSNIEDTVAEYTKSAAVFAVLPTVALGGQAIFSPYSESRRRTIQDYRVATAGIAGSTMSPFERNIQKLHIKQLDLEYTPWMRTLKSAGSINNLAQSYLGAVPIISLPFAVGAAASEMAQSAIRKLYKLDAASTAIQELQYAGSRLGLAGVASKEEQAEYKLRLNANIMASKAGGAVLQHFRDLGEAYWHSEQYAKDITSTIADSWKKFQEYQSIGYNRAKQGDLDGARVAFDTAQAEAKHQVVWTDPMKVWETNQVVMQAHAQFAMTQMPLPALREGY